MNYTGKKLGFGCMRMPILKDDDQTSFNYEKIEALFDMFLENGFTYFDTAHTYHGYKAEEAVGKALVARHKRDSFQIATKMPMRDVNSYEDMEKKFDEQLASLQTDYIDFYLLHNLGSVTYRKAEEIRGFEFGFKKKAEGKIKNFGFSFHDTPELLEEILTKNPDVDFVQLQINYLDWENPNIQARRCYEVAVKHNKKVIVMEPIKGGTLANVPEEAEKMMKEYAPDMTPASWAIRYAASLENVFMVLSGMNEFEQLKDNMGYMKDFKPLNEEEISILEKVTDIINKDTAIACTNCRYCEKGCPMKIAIPDYFSLYNSFKRTKGNFSSQYVYYLNVVGTGRGKASECIGCGQCEQACPQHLNIIEYLKDVSEVFDKNGKLPSQK